MYTIRQVSEMFGLPISTLRYYDKQGLFLGLERTSGIRRFNEKNLEALRIIECLKRSGLELKDIKQFMDWCMKGTSTYPQRKELFEQQKKTVEAEIEHLNRTTDTFFIVPNLLFQIIDISSFTFLSIFIKHHLHLFSIICHC